MAAESERSGAHRPLLILVSESTDLPARVRSHNREIRWWRAGAESGRASDARPVFGGDPTDSASYAWARDASALTAVIDLQPAARARAALEAVRAVRPDAAVLLLSDDLAELDRVGDGTLARSGELRDVLRLDLDDELERLEAERRVHGLRCFASGTAVVPILIHPDPDPDAVSSACAVATLLANSQTDTPIVTFSEIMRPENRRMVDLLNIRVTRVSRAELDRFERVITVDMQPAGLQVDGHPEFAVIDHHPEEDGYTATFADIRPDYGATATILTEYLRAAAPAQVGRVLATALLFGIRTDTGSLMRAVTRADVEAYAFLQARTDLEIVRKLQRSSYALDTARALGAAVSAAACVDDLCVCFIGELSPEQAHVMADLADFCLDIETVTRAVAAATIDGNLVLTLRDTGARAGVGAGDLARAIAAGGGNGGGHATMARVVLPADCARELLAAGGQEDVASAIRELVSSELASLERT